MKRTKDWGFPRWGGYGAGREPEKVRMCDHEACGNRGEYPAPKSPGSSAKWWFCLDHVSAYNRAWDYFAGLSAEEAERLSREEAARAGDYTRSSAWDWANDQSHGKEGALGRARSTLGVDDDAGRDDIKRAYRTLAKRYHPDINPGDEEAARRFHEVQLAYDLLMTMAL